MRARVKKIIALFDSAVKSEQQYQFQNAKRYYKQIVGLYPKSPEADIARDRIVDMDALTKEKQTYKRIHRNARRVLTEIGMDISGSQELMDILINADAIDFDNEKSLFVPLSEDYVELCLSEVPSYMAEDPGENAFGTGATPPFLLRSDNPDLLAPATREEFMEICRTASDFTDSLGIFSVPVATDKSINDFECAKYMEEHFSDLKMTYTKNMTDDEASYFCDRDDWLDGTSLITSMTYMPSMVEPFLRSIRSGNNLLLLDLTIAGSTGPISPEALLTQIHAQVLFMMIVAQTVNPNCTCVHGGIPDVLGISGDLCYSDPSQPIINSAMARLNMWVTGYPSAQSGGSTSIIHDIQAAVYESERSRNTLRAYGVHILRHAMGAMGSLNYFSLDKFIMDCEQEREARRIWLKTRHDFIIPLYFPEDKTSLNGIREIAQKGGAKNADHTLKNIGTFLIWLKKIEEMSKERTYYPELKDSMQNSQGNHLRTPKEERSQQLQETFFLDGELPSVDQ